MKFSRIKGNPSRQVVRLPRAGKIRLGIKKKSMRTGNEYPVEVDYFVVPPEVQRAINEKEPKRLRVMLPTEDEEMVLRQYYAAYGSNQRLKCQGDGEQAERRTTKTIDGKDVEAGTAEVACPGPETCEFANAPGQRTKEGKPGCTARTDLMVILPEVNMGAAYQISTGSTVSDIDIRSGIEMARAMVGRISWLPLILEREERKIPDPSTGKMQTHWPVKLMPAFDLHSLAQLRADNHRIASWSKQYALPEPEIDGESDTPIDLVDHVAGESEEAEYREPDTPSAGTGPDAGSVSAAASPPQPPPAREADIDPVASGYARDELLKRMATHQTSGESLTAIGAEIAKHAHTLTTADIQALRDTYAKTIAGPKARARKAADSTA